MTTPLANQPAFPARDSVHQDSGLTTRQLFAAMAMQGVLANETFTSRWYRDAKAPSHYGMRVAEEAVYMADALLAALEGKP